jgi:hypothetical protein
MPIINITNTVPSQALRGQNVKITVDLATQLSEFSQLQIGQSCVNAYGVGEGIIYSIDNYGNSFEVTPIQPNLSMQNSSLMGYVGPLTDIDVTV